MPGRFGTFHIRCATLLPQRLAMEGTAVTSAVNNHPQKTWTGRKSSEAMVGGFSVFDEVCQNKVGASGSRAGSLEFACTLPVST